MSLADVVGPPKMTAIAAQISAQLRKQIASSSVLGVRDLLARHALDAWSLVRQGISFDFLPRAVSAIDDELYTGVEWSALRAMAQDPALVDGMKAAAANADTLFGYPADAGP